MRNKWKLPAIGVIAVAAVLLAILSGCSGNGNPADDSMNDNMIETIEPTSPPTETPSETTKEHIIPEWFDYEFTDARTGETFTINDYQGKVILIQPIVLASPECLEQMSNLKPVFDKYGGEDGDFVAIALNVSDEEDIAMLKAYAEYYEFNWLFTVPSDDIFLQLVSSFGQQYADPTSIPIALIDKNGNLHNLPVGPKTIEQLFNFVEVYLD